MKNTKNSKLVAILLLVTMLALIALSGTYAKYTTTFSGTGNATVAKFDVSATGLSKEGTETFDLFKTVEDTKDGNTETDVTPERIAPGTQGAFEIALSNNSEVTVGYDLTLSETNADNIPIEYSLDNGRTWKTTADFSKQGTLNIPTESATTETVTVKWRWVYEASTDSEELKAADAADLVLGTATTAPTVSVTASVVFTQVD